MASHEYFEFDLVGRALRNGGEELLDGALDRLV
jgi:hypothetical protein